MIAGLPVTRCMRNARNAMGFGSLAGKDQAAGGHGAKACGLKTQAPEFGPWEALKAFIVVADLKAFSACNGMLREASHTE